MPCYPRRHHHCSIISSRLLMVFLSILLSSSVPRSTSAAFTRLSPAATTTSTFFKTGTTPALRSISASSTMAPARTALEEQSTTGEFVRKDAAWRNWISQDKDATFPAENDRYHLFVAYACPWAHRTLITRAVKGLEDVISVTVVHPVWQKTRPDDNDDHHTGWVFGNPQGAPMTNTEGIGGPFPAAYPNNEPEPFFHSASIRDLYEHANDSDGKYSVPVLWDKKKSTIVSNESAEIIRMLNSELNAFAKYPDLDIRPDDMVNAIDEVNEWIYPTINNGVYRCGFAKSQTAYDTAITELTDAFDRLDQILQKQRFVAGDRFTEADIRLFVTLLRFDEVYVVYFKTNTRSVAHTPALLNYCREIYQMPGVKETVDMDQIKAHYYCSHPTLNHYSIIPRGADFIQLLEEPHDRDTIMVGKGNKKAKTGE